MAYDEALAERIRTALGSRARTPKKRSSAAVLVYARREDVRRRDEGRSVSARRAGTSRRLLKQTGCARYVSAGNRRRPTS